MTDLTLLGVCGRAVREMLAGGEDFLDAFDDGRIDGREEIKLKHTRARIIRTTNRLFEIAQNARRRNTPTAA